nr:hypothetical protein [Tanacetum cinerariifolium]
MEHADISMEARVVVEPVVETVISKPDKTEIASEILSAFEPMDVDMVVDPTIPIVEEELPGCVFELGEGGSGEGESCGGSGVDWRRGEVGL